MRIVYEDRGGRRYAYRCTSKRVPGSKNPVSRKEYLGVVDPETGEIVPKRNAPSGIAAMGDGVDVREYGNVLIVTETARRLGIPEELTGVFGDRGRRLLALALAMALRPSSSDTLDQTLDTTGICDMLGIGRMSSRDVRETINSITGSEMRRFFERRWLRDRGRVLVYGQMTWLSDPVGGRREMPGMSSDDCCVMLMMTEDGMPVVFHLIYGPLTGTPGITRVMHDMTCRNGDCSFMSDTELSPFVNLREFIRMGVDFMIPYNSSTEQYRCLEDGFRGLMEPENRRTVEGRHYYYTIESSTALVFTQEGYTLVPSTDRRFGGCGMRLRTYMTFDPRIRSKTLEMIARTAENVRDALNGRRSDDPERSLREVAGPLAPYFRCSTDSDGRMRVTVRRREISELRERSCRMLVLASTASWDAIMNAHFVRLRTIRTMRSLFANPGYLLEHLGRGTDLDGVMFVEYLSMMIYSDLQRRLDEAGETDLTITDALFIASTYRTVTSDGVTVVSSRSRRVAKVLRVFGIEDPRDAGSDGTE